MDEMSNPPLADDDGAADEAPERFTVEITDSGMIHIHDAKLGYVVEKYTPEVHMQALTRLAELNRRDAQGARDVFGYPPESTPFPVHPALAGVEVTPDDFLKRVLPAYATRQRGDALLAEVSAIEAEAMKMIKEGAEILTRAVSLRGRLERRLRALNAAESAQIDPARGTGTPVSVRCEAEMSKPPVWAKPIS